MPTDDETLNIKIWIHFSLHTRHFKVFLYPLYHQVDSFYKILNSHMASV